MMQEFAVNIKAFLFSHPTTPSKWQQKIIIHFMFSRKNKNKGFLDPCCSCQSTQATWSEKMSQRQGESTRQAQHKWRMEMERGGWPWKRTWEGQGEEKKAWKRTKLEVHTKCKRAMGEMEDGRREIGGEKRGTLNGGGQGESESERGRAGWGLWLPLLTAIDFL